MLFQEVVEQFKVLQYTKLTLAEETREEGAEGGGSAGRRENGEARGRSGEEEMSRRARGGVEMGRGGGSIHVLCMWYFYKGRGEEGSQEGARRGGAVREGRGGWREGRRSEGG